MHRDFLPAIVPTLSCLSPLPVSFHHTFDLVAGSYDMARLYLNSTVSFLKCVLDFPLNQREQLCLLVQL